MSNMQLSASFYTGKFGYGESGFQIATTKGCPNTFDQIVYVQYNWSHHIKGVNIKNKEREMYRWFM
jgi:hypothetical protein